MPVAHWRVGAVAMAVVLTLGAGACGSSSKTATSTTANSSGGVTLPSTTVGSGSTSTASGTTIDIKNFMFNPSTFQAKVGQTITVTNDDNTNHSLTATDNTFDTGVFSSGSKTITITKAGTYTIHCRIHSFMMGTIVAS